MPSRESPEDMWAVPSPIDPEEDRREIRQALAPIGASLGTFVIAAYTVPLNANIVDEIVLAVIIGLVAAAGRMGGRGTALYAALMGALSFDFFHVEPIRALHLRTLLACFALLGLAAWLASNRPGRGSRWR